MKHIIITLALLSSITFAHAGLKKQRELKNEVNNCENALKVCLSSKDVVHDTIFIYSGKQAVKVAKQSEKTKRKLSKQENKTSRNNQDEKTKRNFVFQLFQTIRTFIGSLTLGQLFGGGAGASGLIVAIGGFFEKYRPLTKFASLFKK